MPASLEESNESPHQISRRLEPAAREASRGVRNHAGRPRPLIQDRPHDSHDHHRANKGPGYEPARRIIDITNGESVAGAAENIMAHEGRVDVLINNAGIVGSRGRAEDLTGPDALGALNTNVAGLVRVKHAFRPLLRPADGPALVDVSSGMGSFAVTYDPDRIESRHSAPLYTASKAAVTMLATQYARTLPGIRVIAADP